MLWISIDVQKLSCLKSFIGIDFRADIIAAELASILIPQILQHTYTLCTRIL